MIFLAEKLANLTIPLLKIIPKTIGPDKPNFKRKIVNIFLSINYNICFGYSNEPSHRDGPF